MGKVFVSSVDLKEFRGIKEIKEQLEFNKFNILVGRNNSGKSAILHALSLLPDPELGLPMGLTVRFWSPREDSIQKWENRRGVFNYLLGGSDSAIYRYAGTAVVEFSVKGKSCQVKIGRSRLEFIVDGESNIPTEEWLKQLGIERERAKDLVAFVPNDSTFFKNLKVNLKQNWSVVEKSGAHYSIVRDIINKSVTDTFTEVTPREGELYARKEENGVPFYVKVRDLGDGIKKMLSVLLWLEASSPELVLWDDFEASVHPTLIKLVLEWLMKKDWQVVLTTHSIDVLLKLLEIDSNETECSIIFLQKTSDDILLHKTHTLEELEDFVISNQDPRLLPDLLKL
ncbi:MAG TPA: AAA family ATPase [Desulfobacteria bacterium]|nr:AAA family ATPase [Desulfobacteria bacterium]